MTKVLVVLFPLACHSALAQSSNGYIVAGIGSSEGKLISQAALGGEFVIRRVVGWGGEIGAVAGHDSFAIFSLNGYYHPPVSTRGKVDPFVTGGYTAAQGLLGGFEGNLVNLGGGLNYWLRGRIGLRMEFRGLVRPGTIEAGVNKPRTLYSIRAGIAIH